MRATRLALTLVALVPLSQAVADNPTATTKPAAAVRRPTRRFPPPPPPTPELETRVSKLRYAEAVEMYNALSQILREDQRADRLLMSLHRPTNSILISATPDVFAKINGLIRSLDVETVEHRVPRVFWLKYADANQLRPVLETIAQQWKPAVPDSKRPGIAAAGRHALVVTGTRDQLETIDNLVTQLDTAGPVVAAQAPAPPTHVQIVIYNVALPRDRITSLSVDDLTSKAGTLATLQKALAEFGDAAVLYRIDQVVKLSGKPSFTIGLSTPYVKEFRATKGGDSTTQIAYTHVGCSIDLSGAWLFDHPDLGDVRMDLKLTSMDDSTVDLGNDRKAKVFREIEQRFQGPIRTGRPVVLLSLDAGVPKDTATAYVTRFELTRSQP